MICGVCGKSEEEVFLHEGIYGDKIISVCTQCAETESIPLIRKPDEEQLQKADEKFSVRERMERMAGLRKDQPSFEQMTAHANLKSIKLPQTKQQSDKLVDNYYWTAGVARKRKKITLAQLSQSTGISEETIENIEKGLLPDKDELEKIMRSLEIALSIQLLKDRHEELTFKYPEKTEAEIVEEARKNLEKVKKGEVIPPDRSAIKKKIEQGDVDFSKKEEIRDVTLSDLVDMKKAREKKEMFGEDIELDENS